MFRLEVGKFPTYIRFMDNMNKDKFQLMPPLGQDEYQALKEDIQQRGVLVPIVVDADGTVIDGHHRKRAYNEIKKLGFELPDLPVERRTDLANEQDKRDLAVSLNLQRRHLNRAQR